MMPICSTTSNISSHYQRTTFPLKRASEINPLFEDCFCTSAPYGSQPLVLSFKPSSSKLLAHMSERVFQSSSTEVTRISSYTKGVNEVTNGCHKELMKWDCLISTTNETYSTVPHLNFIENPNILQSDEVLGSTNAIAKKALPTTPVDDLLYSGRDLNELNSQVVIEQVPIPPRELQPILPSDNEYIKIPNQLIQGTQILSEPVPSESFSTVKNATDVITGNPLSNSDAVRVSSDTFLSLKENIDNFLSQLTGSVNNSAVEAENTIKNAYDGMVLSSQKVLNGIFSSVDTAGDTVSDKMGEFKGDVRENVNKVGSVSLDVLRWAVIKLEDYLWSTGRFLVYYYGTSKEYLPSNIREMLNISEEKASQILTPIEISVREVYKAIESLEKEVGLDSNDPLIPFAFFVGVAISIWISYRVLKYGGYSGDLSATDALEILKGEEYVVLVDVRPEDLREKDGIPDLRRGERFKYASVNLTEMNSSVKKLLRNVREVDDSLIAAVICNLKIVQDRSKVIVMDANGIRSKGIARSLRKLGVKRSYLLKGGFESWVKNDLRVKELRPETTLAILKEDAEAILEDLKPTPVQIIGYSMGFMAALFALFEWEKTLQLIGVIGLGQSIYQRIDSYEDSEGFIRDVRLLLAPVRLGTQALSWVSGKFEPNKTGLPTSPSSSAVQDRVIQAAAKHDQPSDSDGTQELSSESSASAMDTLDLNEV